MIAEMDDAVRALLYRVEAQRLKLGLSREALSTEAGYGRSYWSDTMNGRSKCRCVDAFQRCAEVVGMNLCVNGRAASVNQILLAIDDEHQGALLHRRLIEEK